MADDRTAARLHIGTYEKSGGRGLYPVAIGRDGALSCGEPYAGAANASFAAAGPDDRWFIVDEAAGTVGAFSREGEWRLERRFPACGEQPCYLAVDSAGRRLAAANYGSGSVALWRLDGGGMPLDPPQVVQSHGTGPVADRQEGPHCHCAVFGPDGSSLYVTDLGADAILRLQVGRGEEPQLQTAYEARPGTGPRHLLFAPGRPFAVLVSELASTLTTFAVEGTALRAIESRSTLPPDFDGESIGGHLALDGDGRRIYVSNRGHDCIAVFRLDDDGHAPLFQHIASGGSSPRHFVLLEDLALLVVAHEKDGAVTSFRIGEDGLLTVTGHRITVPGSCFVLRP